MRWWVLDLENRSVVVGEFGEEEVGVLGEGQPEALRQRQGRNVGCPLVPLGRLTLPPPQINNHKVLCD